MNFVSRGVAVLALFGTASSALAFGTISFQYIVPNNGVWPPTTFTPAGGWNTVNSGTLGITTPGLRIPGIQQAFDQTSVPLAFRGDLLQVVVSVDGYARVAYIVDNGDAVNGGDVTTTLTGTLTVKQPTTTAPGPGFPSGSTTILSVISSANETKTTTASTEGGIEDPDFLGSDTASGILVAQNNQTGTYTSGTTFSAFNSAGLVYLPIQFAGSADASGSGNYAIDGNTFGAARVTITYTYLPESEWAWAGLPFAFGGWLVRRKFSRVVVKH
jgi:hypothetical protein